MTHTNNAHRVVVLGGGIAGLLAAAALAPRHDSILIVERDLLPAGPHDRRGVPQGRHVHAMLPRGLQAAEELLPGFTERLVAAGALRGDICADARWHLNGRRLRAARSGLTAVAASRALIEHTARDMVRRLPNVRFLDGYDIVGLGTDGAGHRVVRVTSRHGDGSRVLPAGLVVDATGRGSRMPQWLAEAGVTPPEEEVVTIDLRYSTRIFADDGRLGTDLVAVTARYDEHRRSSVVQRLEGGRILVTLAGVRGEVPPTGLDDFLRYAESLPVPDTADVVRGATPLGDAATFRIPAYVRRRYERAEVPDGIVVIGDAACAFNPVYGQGMSVAALCALALRDGQDGYFARQAEALEAPWALATGSDLGGSAQIRALQLAACDDDELAVAFLRVTALVDPPSALGLIVAQRLPNPAINAVG
ncbi:FAD-dependent oxidoreductase [Dactylosporangium sp. AC04546]|uniref:NAD(P)/FAD-dependent oxidoreductase n=1 Tax=Dactylosporangium sp. AC04546 TaxID=2862460 RepID=UPI001EDCDD87|nr:FAD-dependent oxidoreductase [Dactylosporangium sp. AC04546]WVK78268.1 FAD-dependent oxidoreductase [Dactylosporangium sp. AC04546]